MIWSMRVCRSVSKNFSQDLPSDCTQSFFELGSGEPVDLVILDLAHLRLEDPHLQRLRCSKFAYAIAIFSASDHLRNGPLILVLFVASPASAPLRQLRMQLPIMEDLPCLQVVLPVLEQGHGSSGVDDLSIKANVSAQ